MKEKTLTVKELMEKLDWYMRLDPDLPVEMVGDYADTFNIGDVKLDEDKNILYIMQPM